MKREKKVTLRFVVHSSFYSEGEKQKRKTVKRVHNNSGQYVSTIKRKNGFRARSVKKYFSVTVDSPDRIEDGKNIAEQQIQKYLESQGEYFLKTKKHRSFTQTVQQYDGSMKNRFRAKVKGEISEGARMFSINKDAVQASVKRTNAKRAKKGLSKKRLQFNQVLETMVASNINQALSKFTTLDESMKAYGDDEE